MEALRGAEPVSGSFRDPSGQVFFEGNHMLRSINACFRPHWEEFIDCGLADALVCQGSLLPFEEAAPLPGSWKTLRSERKKVISYPYEWCFSQLQDAALLTLRLLREALQRGMILKDASAYNVQFAGTSPVFIDLLSFEKHEPTKPWAAYLQFCRHFLAPLALLSFRGELCGRFSTLWTEGVPLELASSLLPFRSKFSPLLLIHLHLHARMQKKYGGARSAGEKAKKVSLKPGTTARLCESLETAAASLCFSLAPTEWSHYYADTNYTESAALRKKSIVDSVAARSSGTLAIDLGANTGEYSRVLAGSFEHVLAADMDHLAVERHYLALKREGGSRGITPLVLDLCNPSPDIGFANMERFSFARRFQADMLTALALLHHLTLGAGTPLEKAAECFSDLIKDDGVLLLEFVPLEDSQVQRVMAARELVFDNYHLEGCIEAFSRYFVLEEKNPLPESLRTLLVFKKKP